MSTAAAINANFSASDTRDASDSVAARLRALDALLDLPVAELEQRYVAASVPSIGEVRGNLRGRMLAWPSLAPYRGVQSAIRSLAGAEKFPWRGKTFTPLSDLRGEGINRVFTDRFKLFRFETFIGPSRAGAFDALQLDYAIRGNPPVIRDIKDEIRTVAPGLWLGQAWLKTPTREWLWLYFALASTDPTLG